MKRMFLFVSILLVCLLGIVSIGNLGMIWAVESDGLILWNTMGSEYEVEHSQVGPDELIAMDDVLPGGAAGAHARSGRSRCGR